MRRLRDYLALVRPRVAALVGAAAAAGFWIGAGAGAVDTVVLAWAVAGVMLAAGGASALNQCLERDADARMRRTAGRPLPAGRMGASEAAAFGILLLVGGLVGLAVGTGLLAAGLCAASAVLYLGVYTPLKRRSALNTLAGAVPGAMPPLVGWAAATGDLAAGAWALFGILFLWQLPHFLAIAWVYRDEYAAAGFRMLPLGDRGGAATARQTVVYALALVPVSLLPAVLGLGGSLYFFGALYLGAGFAACAIWFRVRRTEEIARQFVFVSVTYLPTLLWLLVQDASVVP